MTAGPGEGLRGRLIVLEGAEGVGKSTQIRRLGEFLARAGEDPLLVREPGGSPLGEELRSLLLDPAREIPPRAEALLFMASRADLMARVIEPALAAGRTVLADRFFLSTYAYQVYGRGLQLEEIRAANALATARRTPDLTLLLTLPDAGRRARTAARGGLDRIERAGDVFHDRVAAAFVAFLSPEWQETHPETGPIAAVDADGSVDQVLERILAVLAERWPETFAGHWGVGTQR